MYDYRLPSGNARHYADYALCKRLQPLMKLALCGEGDYTAIAAHIKAVFHRTYGADVEVTYPLLMGLMDEENNPQAALGIRCGADEQPLFLEQYLDAPVEHCVVDVMGRPVMRDKIAEAGNLASAGRSDLLSLLYGLACYLDHKEVEIILFTGTSFLKQYLNRLDLYPHELAHADPAKLGEDAVNWGSYYTTNPKVMAGSVAKFRQGLEAYFNKLAKRRLQ